MKKSLFIAGVLALALTACGKKPAASGSAPAASAPAASAAAPAPAASK